MTGGGLATAFFVHGCTYAAEKRTGLMRILLLILVLSSLAACAGGPPKAPYPVFMQVNELEDVFLASLPGVRAKQLAGDSQTRRTSNRIDLPQDWRGTSGGVPGRSMEIYVLAGTLVWATLALVLSFSLTPQPEMQQVTLSSPEAATLTGLEEDMPDIEFLDDIELLKELELLEQIEGV